MLFAAPLTRPWGGGLGSGLLLAPTPCFQFTAHAAGTFLAVLRDDSLVPLLEPPCGRGRSALGMDGGLKGKRRVSGLAVALSFL